MYCVYEHWYKGKCFYVGSGIYHRDNISKSRAYDFINRSPDWFNYCDGETEKIEVELLFQTNDRKLAFDKEEEITKTYIEKGYKLINKNLRTRPSAETRKKISDAKKGKMSGKDHPMYGKNHSEETRKRMSLALKGRKHSSETKIKMSLAKKGENNSFYGKKHSDEAREKISKSLSGENHPYYGKKRSEDFRNKISKALSIETILEIDDKKIEFESRKECIEYCKLNNICSRNSVIRSINGEIPKFFKSKNIKIYCRKERGN